MIKNILFVCLFLFTGSIYAQPVCNGELGSPILNFDFGQGNNTDNAYNPLATYAPGLSTNTVLQPSGVLGTANTSALVKNSGTFGAPIYWLNSNDHTGNTNGLFFGINMPDNLGDTVVEYEMTGLCSNTTLQFSIWLLNMMAPTHPLITTGNPLLQYPNMIMRIVDQSGSVLGSFTTGNVPHDGTWHQYSFLFTNGNNSTVKLQLLNNTAGSTYGNDVALDDITIRPCVPAAHISPKLDTTFCKTTSRTFTANITAGIYSPPVYQWQYSTNQGATWIDGGAATSNNTYTFNFSTANAPSEYWIRYLVSPSSAGGNTNCHAISDTSKVRIDSLSPNFLYPSDTTLCPNVTISLPSNAINASAYLWSTGATTQTIDVTTTGTYWLKLVSQYGCNATDTMHVAIPTTSLAVNFSYDIAKACTDDTVRFTNLSDQGKYWWSFGDQVQPDDTTTNPIHIYSAQNSYVIRLKLEDSNGCVDSVLKIIDTKHPLIAAFTQSADSLCQNSGIPVQFTNTSTGAITGYNWIFGDGGTSNIQSPSHLFTLAGYKTISLVIHDVIPCYDTAEGIIRIDSLPFLSLNQNTHEICKGDEVIFNPNYLQTTGGLSWNFGDGTAWNASDVVAHHYENAGIYYTTVTGNYGLCGIVTAKDSVVVNDFLKVNLGPDTVLCLDQPAITVKDINNENDPLVAWLWNTGASTSFINIVHPGLYSVTATKNGCSTTENIEVNKDCYTDIPNVFTPNGDGVNDYFYPRELLSKGIVGFNMDIYDRWGQKVFETESTNGRGWDGKFNGKDQPVGVYIYTISTILKNGRTEAYNGNLTLLR